MHWKIYRNKQKTQLKFWSSCLTSFMMLCFRVGLHLPLPVCMVFFQPSSKAISTTMANLAPFIFAAHFPSHRCIGGQDSVELESCSLQTLYLLIFVDAIWFQRCLNQILPKTEGNNKYELQAASFVTTDASGTWFLLFHSEGPKEDSGTNPKSLNTLVSNSMKFLLVSKNDSSFSWK